jgi:hypothetical protein
MGDRGGHTLFCFQRRSGRQIWAPRGLISSGHIFGPRKSLDMGYLSFDGIIPLIWAIYILLSGRNSQVWWAITGPMIISLGEIAQKICPAKKTKTNNFLLSVGW